MLLVEFKKWISDIRKKQVNIQEDEISWYNYS